ncbi:hypothetical protein CJ480_17930 [Bacillus subtilis]|uniref:hypothetical protein n=1 Tax=Bacillus subtilis TaxID=1423 RepID=UPI000E71D690|nr:hypothetical protein [Bacillus subtilis]RJS53573.1 hypothetical protein CJ480_17930 [Bacillus subtilis]
MNLSDSIGLAIFTICLTFLTNIGFKFLQNKFDFMVDTRKFKRDYCYNQLSNLYLELYAVIAQSEYLRALYNLKREFSYEEVPFIEKRIHRKVQRINDETGNLEEVTEEIKTPISEFNKQKLIDLIMENKKFASPALIKITVAYRYSHQYYLRDDLLNSDKFKSEELKLLHKLTRLIIKETNEKLKYCKMEFVTTELENGYMESDVFDKTE